jgi:hypothetical protein
VWTPLQRQYIWSYLWSAVSFTKTGSYDLLVAIDGTERRTARDAEVVPVSGKSGRDAFGLSPLAACPQTNHLEWDRRDWDHAAVHALLQHAIYQGQSLFDLARPSLWGVLIVLITAVLPIVDDALVKVLHTRNR